MTRPHHASTPVAAISSERAGRSSGIADGVGAGVVVGVASGRWVRVGRGVPVGLGVRSGRRVRVGRGVRCGPRMLWRDGFWPGYGISRTRRSVMNLPGSVGGSLIQ